jgi:tetrathionate reductase subunit B
MMKSNDTPAIPERRFFLRDIGRGAACAGAAVSAAGMLCAAGTEAASKDTGTGAKDGTSFPAPGYDWTKHRWAFAVDATKCIGCLRCMEACKRENHVALDAHHFRTWVERYAYIDGEEKPHVDTVVDPVHIEAAGSEKQYRFANRYRDAKVDKAFFVPKLCNHCSHPACVQVCPTGATYKTKDGFVLIDHEYCIGCQYCVQACPYGARFFIPEKGVSDKCTWCYHRVVKGLKPACVEVCPVQARMFGDLKDQESVVSRFIRENRVQVLRPETGNAPNVYYIGLDKEVV